MEAFDADAEVADMLDDFHQGQFDEGREKEEMEAATQAFYDMMDSAQSVNGVSTRCHWTLNGVEV